MNIINNLSFFFYFAKFKIFSLSKLSKIPSPKIKIKNNKININLHPIKIKSVLSLILYVLIQGSGLIEPFIPPKVGNFI